MDRKTQCMKILEFLEEHGSITVRDIHQLGINSATARLTNLRQKGYSLIGTMVYPTNGSRYMVYTRGSDQFNTEVAK